MQSPRVLLVPHDNHFTPERHADMAYNEMISRDSADDPLVPEQFRNELIAELPAQSAVMSLARKVPLSTKTARQPVLSVLPEAYWVNGDSGLKDTSKVDFANAVMTAEELAVIVPIPEAYLDDAQIPIWSVVRPLLVEAIGKRIDEAILFGTGKPVTWTDPAIVPGAIAKSNALAQGADGSMDIGVDLAKLGGLLAEDGYALNGFATKPGFHWQLVGARGDQGQLIYGPSIAQGQPGTIYGLPHADVMNGSWDGDVAQAVGGDWSKCLIGVRQDVTFKVFTEGVITDADGKVLLNLMQQDSVALRVVMRLGYNLPVPASRLGAANARFPFAVLQPPAAP
jgi:HK97 family phage major capsid protein